MIDYKNYKPPEEYKSLAYLNLGCVETVKMICNIHNNKNTRYEYTPTLRIKEVVHRDSHIILTGICDNVEDVLKVCKWYSGFGVSISYEKSVLQFEY